MRKTDMIKMIICECECVLFKEKVSIRISSKYIIWVYYGMNSGGWALDFTNLDSNFNQRGKIEMIQGHRYTPGLDISQWWKILGHLSGN